MAPLFNIYYIVADNALIFIFEMQMIKAWNSSIWVLHAYILPCTCIRIQIIKIWKYYRFDNAMQYHRLLVHLVVLATCTFGAKSNLDVFARCKFFKIKIVEGLIRFKWICLINNSKFPKFKGYSKMIVLDILLFFFSKWVFIRSCSILTIGK